MNLDLTPTELTALHNTGEVRVVRKCEPQPVLEYDNDHEVNFWKWWDGEQFRYWRQGGQAPDDLLSPFPPAGTREVINDIACVWGESGCERTTEIGKGGETLGHKRGPYVWVGHIQKDTE